MHRDIAAELRELVEHHLSPDAPIASALLSIADGLDSQARGLAAVVERLERLEREVLPQDPPTDF